MEFLRGKLAAAVAFFVHGFERRLAERSAGRLVRDLVVVALFGALAVASAAGVASAWIPALEVFGTLQGHLAAAAIVAVLGGLIARSKAWASVAAVVLAVNLGVIGFRVLSADTCTVQMAASGKRAVRVMTLNIWGGNHDFAAVERILAQHHPDILLLEELRPQHAALLRRLRVRYPNQVVCDVSPDCGVAVLSKYRIGPERSISDGHIMALEVRATIEDHDLVLFATHMKRPFAGRGQSDQFEALTAEVAALPENSLVAGDFNSALWSANLSRYVKGAGVCACNLTHATWPEWLGPFGVPIDHIFLKPGVRLLGIATVSGAGSDHKALMATVSVF